MSATTRRVLVADDNAVDRVVLTKIVESAGYAVIPAVDGDDALDKFYSEKPDLVLLDALMPGKDGFAVAQAIKADTSEAFVPVVFLTGLTEANELARCLEAGGDDFLSKPYNSTILRAKLDALYRMREMHQTMLAQRDEISMHHMQLLADQEAAKAVFDNVAHSRQLTAPYVKQLISPLSLFNGDVLLTAQNPANNLYVMLGDFTGHGLAAAIGALPLSDVFYGMTVKGFSLPEIARECNRKMATVLPSGYFCCAALLLIDFYRKTVQFWNGGLPSAYLRRSDPDEGVDVLTKLDSSHLPLGILSQEKFDDETSVLELKVNDRLFLATDGVIEARNDEGEYFSESRLEQILSESAPDALFTDVIKGVQGFIGQRGRDDDLTMAEIRVEDEVIPLRSLDTSRQENTGPRDWKFAYELGPDSLKEFNPLPLLQQVLMEAPYLRAKATEIYTVLAEMYSNALEHGVLGLSSAVKSSAEGFAQYYAKRAKALENVTGFVRFEISGRLLNGRVELLIKAIDSGPGFDFDKLVKASNRYVDSTSSDVNKERAAYHGRGVRLLHELCQTVTYTAPGNQIEVLLQWQEAEQTCD
jgi:DNA-binding response OmpR family regulator/anti-sigma regulatory factor (Ser/Thr protein kinase)